MMNGKMTKKMNKWTEKEDERLLSLVLNKEDSSKWIDISLHFDKTPGQCYSRYSRIRRDSIKGLWKEDEDQEIIELVHKLGIKWSIISKKSRCGRSGKQIRDRYLNKLDPSLNKGSFSRLEDEIILTAYEELGPEWISITKKLKGRSNVMVKNRYHVLTTKRKSWKKGIVDKVFVNINNNEESKVVNDMLNIETVLGLALRFLNIRQKNNYSDVELAEARNIMVESKEILVNLGKTEEEETIGSAFEHYWKYDR